MGTDPQLKLDQDTADLLAGLMKSLHDHGDSVAWGAVDKKQVDALSLVLNLASVQAGALNKAKTTVLLVIR